MLYYSGSEPLLSPLSHCSSALRSTSPTDVLGKVNCVAYCCETRSEVNSLLSRDVALVFASESNRPKTVRPPPVHE